MKKFLSAIAVAGLVLVSFAGAAGAQDDETTVGTVTADPATVPAAGEHTFTASGEGFIPDSTILLGSCTSPSDTLVPGVSTDEEIVASGGEIDPLADCDLANALTIEVDADGNFTAEVTATVGDNFWVTAGTITGPAQAGGTWIPIVDAAAAGQLAVTGVDSGVLAGAGVAMIALGAVAVRHARRED